MGLSNRIPAILLVAGALLAAPAAAQAGTVSVEETHQPEESGLSMSIVHFAAAPGENNVVSIERAEPGPAPETEPPTIAVIVRDTGAPLIPGVGCSGIDAHSATCTMHGWHRQTQEFCGHDCYIQIPGSWWQDAERIELGDGNDAFTSSLGGKYEASWPTEVEGGSGDDRVTTGSGDDTITPGPGDDTVEPGEGKNEVRADPHGDGDDRLDFLPGSTNMVDDSARSEPLHLAHHILGAAGEEDTIDGPAEVIGGSADDELISSGESLDGRQGDDTLIGSPGNDEIDGGPGNDTIRGNGGDDSVYDRQGDDVVEGDGGDDYIRVGTGDDLVRGGPGEDKLYGEAGDDKLNGGAGDDLISGDEGRDTIRGGAGNDRLVSGFKQAADHYGRGADTAIDTVDCGPGRDTVLMNAWDEPANCEERRLVHEVQVSEVRGDPEKGTVAIFFTADATEQGTLAVGGRAVRPESYVSHRPGFPQLQGRVLVQLRRAVLDRLGRTGRVKFVVSLTWGLTERPAVTETHHIGVVLERKKKSAAS